MSVVVSFGSIDVFLDAPTSVFVAHEVDLPLAQALPSVSRQALHRRRPFLRLAVGTLAVQIEPVFLRSSVETNEE